MVQDLPPVMEQGREYLEKETMDPALKQRVQFVPLDFFGSTPVKGCDVYYVCILLVSFNRLIFFRYVTSYMIGQ